MGPAERFANIVRADTDDIRLDEAALCIAAYLRSGVDVDEWCARLDELAAQCPAPTFDAIRGYLFGSAGFRGNTDDYGDPANSLLDAVIQRRLGIPISLAVVLMEVARRHAVPVLGIGMPGHFLARDATTPDQWCYPFYCWAMLNCSACARLFAALHGDQRRLHDDDLAPTPARAILSRMLNNLEHGRLGADPENLARCCELHLTIPDLPLGHRIELLRTYAPVGEPERVERAYAEALADAPDDAAASLEAEAGRLRARWN